MENEVDAVILWVDGSDENWQKAYAKYASQKIEEIRYEDIGTLKYVLRSIEKFTPWIRNVYLITANQVPSWLETDHPKLIQVSHSDIFKDQSQLPSFNSSAIELNLHRIEGLSEQFLLFNDDTIIQKPLNKSYFFTGDYPNDMYLVRNLFHDNKYSHSLHAIMQVINAEIKSSKSFNQQLRYMRNLKYGLRFVVSNLILTKLSQNEIPLFLQLHSVQAHLKSNFIEAEAAYPDIFQNSRSSRFRSESDINNYLAQFWGLIKGKFHPKIQFDKVYISILGIHTLKKQLSALKDRDFSLLCFGENPKFDPSDYPKCKQLIYEFLDKKLSNHCSYERKS